MTTARFVLLDTDTVAPRNTDSELLGYVNDGIKEVSSHLPMLFSTVAQHACTAGVVEQTLSFTSAIALIEVLSIHNGVAVTRFDRPTLDLFRPTWRSDAAGVAQQWAPLAEDPLRFFIYPAAPASQSLDVRYARIPAVFTIDQSITDLPDSYKPALVDYVVYRAELKDDENVLSARSAAMHNAFLLKIGVSNGSRKE